MHRLGSVYFFFNDTATTEIYTLSLHDALPISAVQELHPLRDVRVRRLDHEVVVVVHQAVGVHAPAAPCRRDEQEAEKDRSEEHTSELQSRQYLVCRLLLEKTKPTNST